MFSPLIEQLVQALRCLPGVGPKTAQRMAFQLLERNRDSGLALAKALENAMQHVKHCQRCRILCETALCPLCSQPNREDTTLCVVESPADVFAIEHTGVYRGLYFVLLGHLSPLDGIGPEKIGILQLIQRLEQEPIQEIILATNPTVEGEATAHYIVNLVKDKPIRTTRIAYGVPMGGELELVDGSTLARALAGRATIA